MGRCAIALLFSLFLIASPLYALDIDIIPAAGAGGGTTDDDVTVNSTAVDTTADFDDGDIVWTLTDGGAGGPDAITGTYSTDSVDNAHINWTDIDYLTNEGAGVDEAYGAGWNGDVGPPEKDDIHDAFGATPGGSLGGTWASPTIDDLFIKLGGDVATAGNYDFGGADFELPQAAPGAPDADGEVEWDGTDGTLVLQVDTAHAELAADTDLVIGKMIKSWSATIFEPDNVNDIMTLKSVTSEEFPHGVVITAVYLGIASDTNYTLVLKNYDDFDTINGSNGTIDSVAYSADTTGEILDDTPTYATIVAGQIIMMDIPATDVDWIHVEVYYYEPVA